MTHCLSQLWPIHCHHNSIVCGWRCLKVPVGHLVKHRGYLYSPVLNEDYNTCSIIYYIINQGDMTDIVSQMFTS